MISRANNFKNRIKSDVQFGLWVATTSAYTAEICAGSGFDWILIDGEHAPNDVRSILSQIQAVSMYTTHPVIRPVSADPMILKQLLDIGATSFLVPMIESADQARTIVAATRYPPRGFRGVGNTLARASSFGRRADYLSCAHEEICLVMQIESPNGLEALDEVLKVSGVDGIFVGPSDLAAQMGHLGDPFHPVVQDAILVAIRKCVDAGMPVGILSTNPISTRTYLENGVNFVAIGSDIGLLVRGSEELLRKHATKAVS